MGTNRQQVDSIRIASPCSMEWERMQGDDRVRFCSACGLNVFNLAAMDLEEAAQLISERSQGLCVRLHRRRDGTVLTQDCPVGRQISVKRKRAGFWGLAAGAGVFFAVGSPRQPGRTSTTPTGGTKILVPVRPPSSNHYGPRVRMGATLGRTGRVVERPVP